jgi:hypothetical protein
MKMMILLTLCAIGVLACLSGGAQAAPTPADNQSLATQSLSQMPLAFTKNMGQWDDRVLFRASSGGATMWFTKEGVTYQFTRRIDARNSAVSALGVGQNRFGFDAAGLDSPIRGKDSVPDSVEQLVLAAKFLGGNPNPEVVAEGEMEYKCNYFLGNEPTKWRTDVPNYESIVLKDVYPGIDIKYSDGGAGQAAYEFVVAPGADMSQIKVAYEGAEATSLDADGQLVVQTKWGNMTAAIGSTNQSTGVVSPRLALSLVTNRQNREQLSIQSISLSFSTYLQGGGDDKAFGIALNGNGNAYVTGYTNSADFPTVNQYQTDRGYVDAFVSKLSSTGNSLIYSTYLGGNMDEDIGYAIAVDGIGRAIVTGYTYSSDFPTDDAFQATYGGNCDAFVTALTDSGGLAFSTYLGGEYIDEGRSIAVDNSGVPYLTGFTGSVDFPTLNPYQEFGWPAGAYDAFVTKLADNGSSLVYSTFLGGNGDDKGYGIAVDGNGNAYVTGYTNCTNFPVLNQYQTDGGAKDAFVTKLNTSGDSLVYSTYLAGNGDDEANGIAVNGDNNAYVTGYTNSTDFPTLNQYQTDGGYVDAFITRLSSAGSSLVFSTYLKGNGNDVGYGIAVDGYDNAYVTGYTNSTDFPTINQYQTDGGYLDAFVTKLNCSGKVPVYSTYLAGNGNDEGYGVTVDGNGNTYVTGYTNSTDFPTLNQNQSDGGAIDAFVTKLNASVCTSCGDANSDNSIDVSDAVFLITYIFDGGAAPGTCNYPMGKGDANGDGTVDISDATYLHQYIFHGGPAPHCQCM